MRKRCEKDNADREPGAATEMGEAASRPKTAIRRFVPEPFFLPRRLQTETCGQYSFWVKGGESHARLALVAAGSARSTPLWRWGRIRDKISTTNFGLVTAGARRTRHLALSRLLAESICSMKKSHVVVRQTEARTDGSDWPACAAKTTSDLTSSRSPDVGPSCRFWLSSCCPHFAPSIARSCSRLCDGVGLRHLTCYRASSSSGKAAMNRRCTHVMRHCRASSL